MDNEAARALRPKLTDLYKMDEGAHKYQGIELPPSYRDQVLDPFLEDLTSGTVLDVGAGTCLLEPVLTELGLKSVFVDISVMGIEHAKKENPDIKAARADSLHLPFADESFEAVHLKDVLVHISGPSALILEIRRVLKPGGRVVLVSDEGAADYKNHYYYVDQRRIETILVQTGFEEVSTTSWIPKREEMKNDWYRRFSRRTGKIVTRMAIFAFKP